MNLLVLTKDYPRPDGTHERMFVHVRDLYYAQNGINVTVLNFACDYDYTIDGIKVISLQTYKKDNRQYDIAVSHASNLRNHYRFLKKYEKRFNHIVFFFHGHEVLKLTEDYPRPYAYMKGNNKLKLVVQKAYDKLKLRLWKRYYKKLAQKSYYVFVSNWIFNRFKNNLNLTENDLLNHCKIINNSIGATFESENYDVNCEKKYDFITIRSNLDGSKYGVDIVMKMAEENPRSKFLLIGRGHYFEHNKKPDNVEWINKTMNHSEMVSYLNQSRCAVLMTREDTQGVMTCELAAFGMPVITSDIEVCHEFFSVMPNVRMISNEGDFTKLCELRGEMESNLPYAKDKTYFAENTIAKETELFESILKE